MLSLKLVTEALAAREPVFHRREFGTSRAAFEAMTAPEFWEIGASGKRYDRATVLDILEARHRQPVEESLTLTNFECQKLANDVYLASYQLDQAGRISQRSSIWRYSKGQWQIVFHQGTLIAA